MGIKQFYFFALSSHGKGVSGGDRIFIEFAKRWRDKTQITLFLWEEGIRMCQRLGLKEGNGIKFTKVKIAPFHKLGFVITYIARILAGIKLGFLLKLKNDNSEVLYACSEFWMDSFPALILKHRFPRTKLVCAWYQTAPSPLVGFNEGTREKAYKLTALLYWFTQFIVKPFVFRLADVILVNNKAEKDRFAKDNKYTKILVVLGAVNLDDIKKYSRIYKNIYQKYDAVFQGRFHPQKGVEELIEIWRLVVNKRSSASLALIGDGPLMNSVRQRINSLNLSGRVDLFGYVFDGPKKYKIFAQSKIVLHPAYYDSGGMAAAEAMAFAKPAVGFDLVSYKSYYPKGMVKVEIGNKEEFANSIIILLDNEQLRYKVGLDALEMIEQNWSWNYRAEEILKQIWG